MPFEALLWVIKWEESGRGLFWLSVQLIAWREWDHWLEIRTMHRDIGWHF